MFAVWPGLVRYRGQFVLAAGDGGGRGGAQLRPGARARGLRAPPPPRRHQRAARGPRHLGQGGARPAVFQR